MVTSRDNLCIYNKLWAHCACTVHSEQWKRTTATFCSNRETHYVKGQLTIKVDNFLLHARVANTEKLSVQAFVSHYFASKEQQRDDSNLRVL